MAHARRAKQAPRRTVTINRAPVLTLWSAVVAERLGFRRDEALTLGRAVAGLNAYAKGKALGIFTPKPKSLAAQRKAMQQGARIRIDLLHRAVPAVRTPAGLRALAKNRPIAPESVTRYLDGKFGDALGPTRTAMMRLARSLPRAALADRAYDLYASFRPDVPAGKRGWGARGVLDLARIAAAAK